MHCWEADNNGAKLRNLFLISDLELVTKLLHIAGTSTWLWLVFCYNIYAKNSLHHHYRSSCAILFCPLSHSWKSRHSMLSLVFNVTLIKVNKMYKIYFVYLSPTPIICGQLHQSRDLVVVEYIWVEIDSEIVLLLLVPSPGLLTWPMASVSRATSAPVSDQCSTG